ncbi:hypothetical protein AVEN_134028-1 [Araneus ventricosus]|uniref:Uncharacterized protein n=1 Tax=Araneus ventricosus TaxID=182803 RepID=A0A4Y2K2Z2_ARAVE|nr:hypothetical protein AVEN_134028-1 [Araneus ventricosus]
MHRKGFEQFRGTRGDPHREIRSFVAPTNGGPIASDPFRDTLFTETIKPKTITAFKSNRPFCKTRADDGLFPSGGPRAFLNTINGRAFIHAGGARSAGSDKQLTFGRNEGDSLPFGQVCCHLSQRLARKQVLASFARARKQSLPSSVCSSSRQIRLFKSGRCALIERLRSADGYDKETIVNNTLRYSARLRK